MYETAAGPDHLADPAHLAEPEITSVGDPSGISIRDPIENAVFRLHTDTPVSPVPVETDHFCFPIDTAARIQTSRLVIPVYTNLLVRDTDGELLRDCANRATVSLNDGEYLIEVSSAPMKIYLAVTGEVVIEQTNQQSKIRATGRIDVGVRSFHEHPAGTITVTDAPEDTLDALSYLGSGLKTHSPERSFPTLRGHPPLIERGEEFAVPTHIDRPETGVTLVVPPTQKHAFRVASLAYYLGADVVAGEDPRLLADGRTFALPRESFQTAVNQLLEQVVFLDCLTRVEGYYQVDLYERTQVEEVVSIPYDTLYDAPLDVRTAEYLDIPYEDLAPAIPTWDLTADIEPDAEYVGALPFLADRLANIRIPDTTPPVTESPTIDAVSDMMRGGSDDDAGDDHSAEVFSKPDTDSLDHVFFGDGYPLGSTRGVIDAYHRRLDDLAPDDARIHVHVVCNDPHMIEEGDVQSVYGTRDYLNFDVTLHEQLSTVELADLLGESADFLHYIGHIDADGFACTDGSLDAKSLDTVNIKSFLLNACRSYEQGMALVRNGSLGGIVTMEPISHFPAVGIGRTLARLLNHGFPLHPALTLTKRQSVYSHQYTVIGVGSLQLAQYESGTPQAVEIESTTGDHIHASFQSFSVQRYGVGTIFTPDIDTDKKRCLHPGFTRTFEFGREQFEDFLATEHLPVQIDGDHGLYWSSEISDGEKLDS